MRSHYRKAGDDASAIVVPRWIARRDLATPVDLFFSSPDKREVGIYVTKNNHRHSGDYPSTHVAQDSHRQHVRNPMQKRKKLCQLWISKNPGGTRRVK